MQNCEKKIVSKASNSFIWQDSSFIAGEEALDVMSLEFSSVISTATCDIVLSKFEYYD